MGFLELMDLKGQAEKLSLMAEPDAFSKIAEVVGIKDMSVVESVVKAARLTSRDPSQSVMEWFQDGGLARLIAGKQADQTGEQDTVLQCPHCSGVLIISAP